MWGTRNPCNILLESDCAFHEACGDKKQLHSRSPHGNRHCFSEAHSPMDSSTYWSPRDVQHPCSTPNSTRKLEARNIKHGGRYLEQCHQQDNPAGTIQPVKYDEPCFQGAPREIHSNSASPGDFYQTQFRQGLAEHGVHEKSGRGPHPDNCSQQSQDVANLGRLMTPHSKNSRENLEGTPFACNDCMEPQCLYCWRKLREAKGEFSFWDGFETQEPKWKPARRSVDLYNNCYKGPSQSSLRRQTILQDKSHLQGSKYKPNTCQPSCSPEEPKWKPANNLHLNLEHREPKEQHSTRGDTVSKENEWNWSLGKGRGIGPGPGEWNPPFRKQSSEYPTPTFQRSKGMGAIPNTDDWVPPFRGEEQPYNWHRCKGSGDCPPRDQWLAPWRDNNKEPADRVYGGGGESSCLEQQEVNQSWRGGAREVF